MPADAIPALLVWGSAAMAAILLLHRRFGRADARRPFLVEMSASLLPVFLIVLVLRSFAFEPFRIPSSSMEPTLTPGDYILVNKHRYGLRMPLWRWALSPPLPPKRGDIVVFYPPGDDRYFIKRIVGLPGDAIQYRAKRLFVNGRAVEREPLADGDFALPNLRSRRHLERLGETSYAVREHLRRPGRDFDAKVRAGHYFLMGDNRDNSVDSRVWGQVPRANLIGPATWRWMHWPGLWTLPRFDSTGRVR